MIFLCLSNRNHESGRIDMIFSSEQLLPDKVSIVNIIKSRGAEHKDPVQPTHSVKKHIVSINCVLSDLLAYH